MATRSDAADVAVGYFPGITAWVVGDTMRTQRERAAWMAARRVEEVQQVATEERLAIARDLHDIVAHNVSVIAVQAEAAQVDRRRPTRNGPGRRWTTSPTRRAPRWPSFAGCWASCVRSTTSRRSPGSTAIDELVETVSGAGMDVELSRAGVGPVDAVAGLTAYRVVQEALTNVLKHAGPCATEVASGYRRRCARRGRGRRRVRVARNGSTGHGLVGMRERVSVLGGTLDTGAGTRRVGSRCGRGLPLSA